MAGAPYTAGLFGLGPWGVPQIPGGSAPPPPIVINGSAGEVIECHAVALSDGASVSPGTPPPPAFVAGPGGGWFWWWGLGGMAERFRLFGELGGPSDE
jgi:hypothetical protein